MESFTIVDAVVAVVILISAILAYSRGLVREILAIVGWVAAAVAAFFLTPMAEPLVQEIPVVNEFLAESCELSVIAAFIGVFVIALILLAIMIPLFSGAVQRSAVSGVDQALGFLFGVLRGALLVIVALIVYDRVLIGDPIPAVDQSRTVAIFGEVQDQLAAEIPEEAPNWIVARYEELVGDCGAPRTVTPPETAPSPIDTETEAEPSTVE
jgi:membrane protein required for colicin V production